MSRRYALSWFLVIVGVLVVGVVGQISLSRTVAVADDSDHVTSLVDGLVDFGTLDPGEPEPGVLASFSSTSSADKLLRITLFYRPPGGSEQYMTHGESPREGPGTLDTAVGVTKEDFPSGTTIRAVFEACKNDGSAKWTFERTLELP